MNKRGQFTLFVVLGILLIFLLVLAFVFQDELLDFTGISSELAYPSEVQEVVDHVQECVDSSAYEAVVGIGSSGGYYTLPERSYIDASYDYTVPYYLYDGEDVSLSSEDLESELNTYIASLVSACVDLEQFSSFSIEEGSLSVESVVEQNLVSAEVFYPLTISVGETSYSLSKSYETVIEVNLGWLHSIALQIVAVDLEEPETIDYSSLLEYGVARIVVAPVSEDSYVYILQDTSSGIGNYSFFFAEYYPDLASSVPSCVLDLDCADSEVCTEGECVEA